MNITQIQWIIEYVGYTVDTYYGEAIESYTGWIYNHIENKVDI